MNKHRRSPHDRDPKPVSPATGILFMVGTLGFFHSLLTVVDPLL